MKITIDNKLGLPFGQALILTRDFLSKDSNKEDDFNYSLETHGMFGITLLGGKELTKPIQIRQCFDLKRKSDKSPMRIIIEEHHPLF